MTISFELTTVLFGMLMLLSGGFSFGRRRRLKEIADLAFQPTAEDRARAAEYSRSFEASRIETEKRKRYEAMVADFVTEQAPKVAAAKARRAALAEQNAI